MSGGEVVSPEQTMQQYLLLRGRLTTKPPPCRGDNPALQYDNTAAIGLAPPTSGESIGFHPTVPVVFGRSVLGGPSLAKYICALHWILLGALRGEIISRREREKYTLHSARSSLIALRSVAM